MEVQFEDLPVYKRISSIEIRKEEFAKTTTNKINVKPLVSGIYNVNDFKNAFEKNL